MRPLPWSDGKAGVAGRRVAGPSANRPRELAPGSSQGPARGRCNTIRRADPVIQTASVTGGVRFRAGGRVLVEPKSGCGTTAQPTCSPTP
jgi:hypothetical protein